MASTKAKDEMKQIKIDDMLQEMETLEESLKKQEATIAEKEATIAEMQKKEEEEKQKQQMLEQMVCAGDGPSPKPRLPVGTPLSMRIVIG